MNFDKNTYFKN